MPRPNKPRRICEMPNHLVFGPKGKRMQGLESVNLLIDEYETVRLMDYLGYTQEEASNVMGVARTTVQRIYSNAKKKIADAIVNGKVLMIDGGDFVVKDEIDCCNHQRRRERGHRRQ